MLDATDELRDVFLHYRSVFVYGEGRPLRGKLVLVNAAEQAAGARIAGAAALFVVENGQTGKASVREGHCDCMVTSLDEATRILKNEIRRGAPASVCLHSPPGRMLQECVDRGLQPDFIDWPEPTLARRGAVRITRQEAFRPEERIVVWSAPAGHMRHLEAATYAVMNALTEQDPEREQWLRRAPATLGRRLATMRLLPMRDEEVSRLVNAVAYEEVAAPITATVDGLPLNGRSGEREDCAPKLF